VTTRAAVGIIIELNRQITELEAQLATHSETQPDADIYLSLPGLGVILGVLGEFGDDPNRYTDAKSRKTYAGTSPLTVASGKKRAAGDLHHQALRALGNRLVGIPARLPAPPHALWRTHRLGAPSNHPSRLTSYEPGMSTGLDFRHARQRIRRLRKCRP